MEGIKSHPIGTNLIFASFKRRTWLPYLMYIKLLFIPQVYIEMTDLYKYGSAPFPHSVVSRANFHHISSMLWTLGGESPSCPMWFYERRMRIWQHPLEDAKLQQWMFESKKQRDQSQIALAQRLVMLVGMG